MRNKKDLLISVNSAYFGNTVDCSRRNVKKSKEKDFHFYLNRTVKLVDSTAAGRPPAKLKIGKLKMAQRQYEPFTLFNVRITDMRNLWTPSDTYKGQKQQKPSYFAGFIVQKTQPQWHSEPGLAGLVGALTKLHANNPQIVDWRIQDGDVPSADGKSSEFAKGHWMFNASSGNPVNVEIVQAGGALTKLPNKTGVKSGDYCMIAGTAAVSGQNNRAAKLYLNSVVFSAPGEEIVFANSASGAELVAAAQAQGLRPVGFASGGGFGAGFGGGFAQPQGGPAANAYNAPQQSGPASSAFNPPQQSAGVPSQFGTPPQNPFGR